MNPGILYALACAVCNMTNDLVYRGTSKISKVNDLIAFYFLSSVTIGIMALSGSIIFYGGIGFRAADMAFGAIIGVISFLTYGLFLYSFGGGHTSASVTIYRLNIVPAVILALVFLGEPLKPSRLVAVGLCIASIFLFSGLNRASFREIKGAGRFTIISILACISGGVMNFTSKLAMMNGVIPMQMVFWRYVIVIAITSLFIVFYSKRVDFKNQNILLPAISGAAIFFSIITYLIAVDMIDLSVAAPVSQMSFVLVGAISFIFLKEKVTVKKMIGLVFAVFAVVLIQ